MQGIRVGAFAVCFLLCGCASNPIGETVSTFVPGAPSICQVMQEAPLEEGKVVRASATYHTDKSHYSYLDDKTCRKAFDIENREPISEPTVKEFFDAGDRICVESGATYLCPISAVVDADIRIVRSEDGLLGAELLKVHGFQYKPRKW